MILFAAAIAAFVPAPEDDVVIVGRAFVPVQIEYRLRREHLQVCRARDLKQPAGRVSEACEVLVTCVREGERRRPGIAVCVDRKLFAKWKAESKAASEPPAM